MFLLRIPATSYFSPPRLKLTFRTVDKTRRLLASQESLIHWQNVEKYNAHSKRRTDLFGLGDFLICTRRPFCVPGSLLLQITSKQQIAPHQNKFVDAQNLFDFLADWLCSGNLYEIWGWDFDTRPATRVVRNYSFVESSNNFEYDNSSLIPYKKSR